MTSSLKPAQMPDWPRAMRLDLAAAYVGLSPTQFRIVVDVAPVRLSQARVAWFREDLDAWLDMKAGRPPATAKPTTQPEPPFSVEDAIVEGLAALRPCRKRPEGVRLQRSCSGGGDDHRQ
jgi:predicted DNA-binding transcriptional regulator AlpA